MTMTHAASKLLALTLLLTFSGCAREPAIEIVEGIDVCRECNMVIDQVNQSAGFVSGGEFIPFDSPGCLLRFYESLPKSERPRPEDIYFADYRDGAFYPAVRTTFLLTSHIPTVMNAQVVAFSDAEGAMGTRSHPDEVVTDWYGYRTERGTPEAVLEVVFGAEGMEPELVEADKGDLVVLRAVGLGLEEDLVLSIQGYPEAGSLTIPASGEAVEIRFLASKPGVGFPIGADDGHPLGVLRVTGAHTPDEEVG
jgi:hypothetical protein